MACSGWTEAMAVVAIVTMSRLARPVRPMSIALATAGLHRNREGSMIKGIKFDGVPVTDQQRALEFYTNALGFRVITDQPFDDKQRWIELGIGRASSGITLFTPAGQES